MSGGVAHDVPRISGPAESTVVAGPDDDRRAPRACTGHGWCDARADVGGIAATEAHEDLDRLGLRRRVRGELSDRPADRREGIACQHTVRFRGTRPAVEGRLDDERRSAAEPFPIVEDRQKVRRPPDGDLVRIGQVDEHGIDRRRRIAADHPKLSQPIGLGRSQIAAQQLQRDARPGLRQRLGHRDRPDHMPATFGWGTRGDDVNGGRPRGGTRHTEAAAGT